MINNQYKQASVDTADRGKIIIMIYDHCLKWCRIAIDAMEKNEIEKRTTAIFKVQDGITELHCSLDFEKGGEIAKNLDRLYEFYNKHLTDANIKNEVQNVKDILKMMSGLREAWVIAVDNVRKNNDVNMRINKRSYVSMVG